MLLPITGIGHSLDFLVLIYFYYRIRKSRVVNNKFYYYFERFTLSMSIFFLLMAIPNLFFPNDSNLLGLGYVVGHVFLYLAYAFLIRVSLFIMKPSFDSKYIFKLWLLMGAAITALNIYHFNLPVIMGNGVTAYNADASVGFAITAISILTLLPSAVLFIRECMVMPQQCRRFALIGASFILIIIGGPLHDTASTTLLYVIADVVTTAGFIVMFIGVIAGNKSAITTKK